MSGRLKKKRRASAEKLESSRMAVRVRESDQATIQDECDYGALKIAVLL